jgi:hypothetical protein
MLLLRDCLLIGGLQPLTMLPCKQQMAIACAGYRVSSRSGDHQISIEATKLALGKVADSYADYFDMCRRKRNLIDYTDAHVATESETDEIVRKANEFLKLVESWISANYPFLKA